MTSRCSTTFRSGMPRFLRCPACQGECRPAGQPRHRPNCAYCEGLGLVEVDVLAPALAPPLPRTAGTGGGSGEAFVAVIGSGIGGTALALALVQRGVPVRVFEKDLAFNVRAQGYSLTMQQGTLSLAKLGVAVSGTRPTAHIAFTHDGVVLGKYGRETHFKGGDPSTDANLPLLAKCHKDRHNVQLPRQRLRAVLLRELRRGTIEWGMKFQGYEREANGTYTLRFLRSVPEKDELPVTVPGAAVVAGCDGIYSGVFAQKFAAHHNNSLKYLGVIVILGISQHEDESLTRRVTQTLDGETRIYTMPFVSAEDVDDTGAASKFPSGRNLAMWQLSFPCTQEHAMELHRSGGEGLKAEALRRCGMWHEPLPQLLAATLPEDITGYPAFDRDVMPLDEFRAGAKGANGDLVTVLGDAAHPMSPFKGQGANQALVDAVSLAKRLSKRHRVDPSFQDHAALSHELGEFERDMLDRASEKVHASRVAARFLHSAKALTPGDCIRSAAMLGGE